MDALVPCIQVPMNFGLEYLGSPSHGNLKFLLNDEVLLANSAIMSFNSPVIKKMTVELLQTEIEVKEFSKSAVQCFLEASYSGTLKDISKLNFRDLNKIVHVLEVNWLIGKCSEYFQELTESVRDDNFDEQLFLFDEAMFILKELKKRTFIDVVIKKFTSSAPCTLHFVTRYLRDFSSCSAKYLDVLMELTANQEHILVEALINNMERIGNILDQTSRYILKRLTYKDCSSTYDTVYQYQRLFKKLAELETPTTEDFRLNIRALQQYNKAQKGTKDPMLNTVVPNLFLDFQQLNNINDLEELTTFLIESPTVTNSYIFFDAVFSWLFEKRCDLNIPFALISDEFIEKFADIMQSRGWKPDEKRIDRKSKTPFALISDEFIEKIADIMQSRGWKPLELEYINFTYIYGEFLGDLINKIRNNANMVSGNCFNRIPSKSEYSPEELFARDHDIKFKFKQASITNCSKEGDCGFILQVTAATGKNDDSFNIQLVIDPNFYPDDVHFHRESLLLVEHIHFTFEITLAGKTYRSRSITWHGRPCLDTTEKYWYWGTHCFWKQGETTRSRSREDFLKWVCNHGSTTKIRPVVYTV